MKVKERFTLWQLAALAHPYDGGGEPAHACIHGRPGERSVMLTCDIDDGSAESFGGPMWHVSVFPPVRAKAAALLAKIGEGELFEEPGLRPQIFHMRRHMTAAERARLREALS